MNKQKMSKKDFEKSISIARNYFLQSGIYLLEGMINPWLSKVSAMDSA